MGICVYYQCSWFGLRIVQSKRIKEELNAVKSDYRFANNKTLFEVKDYLVKVQSSESTINLYKTGVIPRRAVIKGCPYWI